MEPEHEVIHLRHDLASQKARDSYRATQVAEYLKIALEALEVDRPHVAIEKIKYALDHQLPKIGT